MKKSILLILGIILFISCKKNNGDSLVNQLGDVCDYKTEIMSPNGFEVNVIGEIDFNGGVQSFQFLDDKIGFAMLSKNSGGYVEVFKTKNGGQTWSNLEIGINQHPINMLFKDENYGIITVHDVSGCPPPNCQNKCVILKTENGGVNWVEVEYENLKGVFYHPKYDNEGNLYANLNLNNQSTLMKSVDNGNNWDTLFSSTELGFNLVTYSFEIFKDKIFISAKDGKIFVINTNGQFIKTIEIESSLIWDMEIIDENNLIVVLSGKVIKSTNGGDSWETIYEKSARMIGFDSVDKGLMLLQKSSCPTDVYQVNDLIASTIDGGLNWIEAEETTTNMHISFNNSQKMGNENWYITIGNKLIEIVEK